MVIKEGYTYVFQKTLANDIKCQECFLRRKGQCKAKIKLSADDAFLNQLNEHSHPPSQTRVEATNIKARIKDRAGNTNDTSQQILGAEVRNFNDATAVALLFLNNIRRNIHHQRDDHNMPGVPQRREDIPFLPNNNQVTNRGDRFLLFDGGIGDVNSTTSNKPTLVYGQYIQSLTGNIFPNLYHSRIDKASNFSLRLCSAPKQDRSYLITLF